MSMSFHQFLKRFPTDDSCLMHIFKTKYGIEYPCCKCGKIGKWSMITKRRALQCQCGKHLYPCVGTPFELSRTPLQKWFFAMYLFSTSRHGVAAKELERQLDVTYKCAWRIAHEIRKHMGEVDGDEPLSGTVEIDETMVGGKRPGKRGRGAAGKTVLLGMMEKDGDVMTKIVPNVKRKTLQPIIEKNVAKGSSVHTDELRSYSKLGECGYNHTTVEHGASEYVRGETHVNSLEGYWSRLKTSIRGTHVSVSEKHLEKYAAEFEYRYNRRKNPEDVFDDLVENL